MLRAGSIVVSGPVVHVRAADNSSKSLYYLIVDVSFPIDGDRIDEILQAMSSTLEVQEIAPKILSKRDYSRGFCINGRQKDFPSMEVNTRFEDAKNRPVVL